ncbi:hypothetical protein FAF44_48170 [Nonomuraea sp. MG754425]|uniref:hypothetical protein n=1 Tax=Nonomuraea sp. MG754425 TaxID=2570319 RepID=UPI001F18127A|nr:hypothetical protein [Nonomuraea sp. MG754425]MCF6476067.1 hypothetical protein [Nonomuraea sp. MG754425]
MRLSSLAAALLAPAVIATPAQAQHAPPTARAAWIKSCYDAKRQDHDPCGGWRLLMRDGRQVTVRGAAGRGVDGKGRVTRDAAAFALSGDGRVMAYERARDHRLVVQRVTGGPVTELPERARPKGVGSDALALTLSPTGDRVLVDYYDEDGRLPTKVITVATGRTTTVPAAYRVLGFSEDADEVLATRLMRDNTTALYALRVAGGSVHGTPPQVIVNADIWALAADGATVATLIPGDADSGKPPRLRTYDLATGALSPGLDLRDGAGMSPWGASWAGERLKVTLAGDPGDGNTTVVRVLTVDPAAGEVARADVYRIGKNYTFTVAGG